MASSSEAMRLLELFELQAQEGPCLDAFRTGERVGHQDLKAESCRWPSFSAAAVQAGFRSASALPLRLREVTLGALNRLSVTRVPRMRRTSLSPGPSRISPPSASCTTVPAPRPSG